jgi:RecB family exonuclease
VSRLSYSSLGDYKRCGYRFYVERVLGLPPLTDADPRASSRSRSSEAEAEGAAALSGTERGILAHALLERLDFGRPAPPSAAAIIEAAEIAPTAAEAEELEDLIRRFATSELCARLGRAADARREEAFAFALESGVLMNGVFDVLAREPGGRLLVVDYKSDRLGGGATPAQLLADMYSTQQTLYALAALRTGADAVDVVHVFLEAPDDPVLATFPAADRGALERTLAELTRGVLAREFAVTDSPQRSICAGCPAEGGLCSWPLEMTRRDALDRLF